MAKRRKKVRGVASQLRDEIEREIRSSGRSVHQISLACGLNHSQLSRFMHGKRTLTLPAVERLCKELGLELTRRAAAKEKE
jgi:transcriptional regulator with XRE-family HTH domain